MPVVLLRRFRPGDATAATRLINEATLATVPAFFRRFATREVVAHLALLSAAVSFVVVGAPLFWSLSALPLTLAFTYLAVWLAHRLKLRRHTDMDDVAAAYLSSDRTSFWVAEVVDENFAGMRFEVEGDASAGDAERASSSSGRLVGAIAVTVKHDPDMRDPPGSVAWLRRMAVSSAFRRRGLGARMVEAAERHCRAAGFAAVELVTTEAHEAARCLYTKKGFEIVQQYEDAYLFGAITVNMYRFRKDLANAK